MEKQFAKKRDVFVILGLLLAALALWVWLHAGRGEAAGGEGGDGPYVEIQYYGDVVEVIYLNGPDKTFTIPQAPQITFERKDGAIAFIQSDCPDQVCVHTGWQRRSGQFAACLPNGVSLFVRDSGEDSVDIVAR